MRPVRSFLRNHQNKKNFLSHKLNSKIKYMQNLFSRSVLSVSSVVNLFLLFPALAMASPRVYEIWEPQPAPNKGSNWESTKGDERRKSYDKDWEQWSYPIGNGYVGASIFGRTDSERIQITD